MSQGKPCACFKERKKFYGKPAKLPRGPGHYSDNRLCPQDMLSALLPFAFAPLTPFCQPSPSWACPSPKPLRISVVRASSCPLGAGVPAVKPWQVSLDHPTESHRHQFMKHPEDLAFP